MKGLPEGWMECRLGDVIFGFETGRSLNAAGHPALPGKQGVLKISAVTWGEFRPDENKALLNQDRALPHETVKAGDLLISRANTTELVGAPVLVDRDHANLMLPDKILRVCYDDSLISPRFLLQALRSKHAREHIEREATGNSDSMRNVSQPKLREVPLRLAPLPEQKRIVDKLDGLFARVGACRERLERIPAFLKRFRQSVLAAATSGELTKEWREEQGQVNPWSNVALADVASDFSYGTSAKSSKVGMVPVLRMGNIQNGVIDWDDLVYTSDPSEISKYQLREGDLLFNRTNSPELVGKAAVYRGERPSSYAGYLIRVRCRASLLPDYLNYCLGSPAGKDYCWRVKSDGVSQSNINAKKLAAFTFGLPPLPEQTEIVRRVNELFSLADQLEARYQAARAQVDRITPSLLAKAFRGELVPQDPRDEPAAALLARHRATAATPARRPRASRAKTASP